MKINADIRAAIRAADAIQRHSSNDYIARRETEKAAIKKFVATHSAAKRFLAKAESDLATADKLSASAQTVISGYGLTRRYHSGEHGISLAIDDDKRFIAAGGKYERKERARWTFNQVMAELASAKDEASGVAILAKYGINWK